MAQKVPPKKAGKKIVVKKAAPASSRPQLRKPPVTKAALVRKPAESKAVDSKAADSKAVVLKSKRPVVAAPAPAPVKEAKKEKVQSLSKSDLQYFRNLLLEKRHEIIGDVGSMESEAFKGGSNLSNMPIHMADVGTDNFEQEFTLGLIESERQILREIQEALIRIENSSFGICLGTGKLIPRVRLEAVPWAKYTIEYSRLLEQGKINQDDDKSSDDDSGSSDDDED